MAKKKTGIFGVWGCELWSLMWLHTHITKMGISNPATLSIVTLRKMEFEVAFTDNFMPAKPKRLVGKCICQSFPQIFFGATSQARLRMSNPHTTAPGTAENEKLKNQRSLHTNLTCRRKNASTNPWSPPQPSWEQHKPAECHGLFLLETFQPSTLHHPAGSKPGRPPALTQTTSSDIRSTPNWLISFWMLPNNIKFFKKPVLPKSGRVEG